MTREEYIVLFEKHLSEKTTPEEEELLLSYRDNFDIHEFDNDQTIENQEQVRNRIYQQITLSRSATFKKLNTKIWWYSAAAVLLAFILITKYFLSTSLLHNKSSVQNMAKIAPADNKAVLILSNGSKVVLTDKNKGVIANQNGVNISKTQSGQLIYSALKKISEPKEILYNTIATPRGGKYQVVLPDGTHVWLNAETKLKYPVQFEAGQRQVELDGEAYFEVSHHNNWPFKVVTGSQLVEVLGTHFNIKSYSDEDITRTTLLEGSVKVSGKRVSNAVTLKPGQIALLKENNIEVKIADTDAELDWKNGYFIFNGEDITTIMQKISRWYDVDVVYENYTPNTDRKFAGIVSRSKRLSDVLKTMERTGEVHFKLTGRKLIVN